MDEVDTQSAEDQLWLALALHSLLCSTASERLISTSAEQVADLLALAVRPDQCGDYKAAIKSADPVTMRRLLRSSSVAWPLTRALYVGIHWLGCEPPDGLSGDDEAHHRREILGLLPLGMETVDELISDWRDLSKGLAKRSRSLQERALVFTGGALVGTAVVAGTTAALVAFSPAAAGLSGAAATSAAVAALGGGSVAAGGGGIAAGVHILVVTHHGTTKLTKMAANAFLTGRRQDAFREVAIAMLVARRVWRDEEKDTAAISALAVDFRTRAVELGNEVAIMQEHVRSVMKDLTDFDIESDVRVNHNRPLLAQTQQRARRAISQAIGVGKQLGAKRAPSKELFDARARLSSVVELQRVLEHSARSLDRYSASLTHTDSLSDSATS